MRLIPTIIVISIFFMASCQTMEKTVPPEPPLSSVGVKTENEEIKKEDSRIKEWEEYMALVGEGDISIDTILRLTEAYLEAKDIQFKKDMEEYEIRMELYNKGRIKAEPKEPERDFTSLVKHFNSLISHYRFGRGADSVRYILGYALSENGKRDEAVKVFEELVSAYQDSVYIPEVGFRLGEFYFETNQTVHAVSAYSRILKYPKSIFYDKALYKLGWTYYKQDDFRRAADQFISILDERWTSGSELEGLVDESLSSIVMSLNHMKDTDDALRYIKSKGPREYMQQVLLRLGDRLSEETRYEAAITVFERLKELAPDRPDIPFILEKIGYMYEQTGEEDKALEARWMMVRDYNPNSLWYKKNIASGSDNVDALISNTLRVISERYHYKGKKGGDLKFLERAIEGYRIFLTAFPHSLDNIMGIHLLLAEALFDAKKYMESANEYLAAAELCEKGQERGEIAHSAFLAYEMIFYQSSINRDEVIGYAQKVLDTYRLDLSKSDRLEKVLSSMADMYKQSGSYDKARITLMSLVDSKDVFSVSKRIAELYLLEGNIAAAEESYIKLAESSKDPSLIDMAADLQYRMANEYIRDGKEDDAIVKLNQSFATCSGSKLGETVLTKLGYIYLQRKDFDRLEEVAKRITKAYPGSDKGISLIVEAGRRIEKESPLIAARLFEYASSTILNEEDALKLLFAAAILNQKGGDDRKALELFRRFLGHKGLRARDEGEARYWSGIIELKTGRRLEGIEMLKSVLRFKGKTDDLIIAKTMFFFAKESQNLYLDTKIVQPFEKTLKKKSRLLNSLLADYSEIAKFGDTELLTEIYFQMGVVLENFRDSILEAEKPKDLTEDDIKEYNFLLEEKAYPYEEQAVKAYEKSLEAGRKQTTQGEWVQKSLERLIYLRPVKYKKEPEDKVMEQKQDIDSVLDIKPEPAAEIRE